MMKLQYFRSSGPAPRFDKHHLIWILWHVLKNGPIGRKMLSKITGIGEGSMRSILTILRNRKLIKETRRGSIITKNGKKVVRDIEHILLESPLEELGMKNFCAIMKVKNSSDFIKSGIEQRDAAISCGAESLVTFIVKDGKILFPDRHPVDDEYLCTSRIISEHFVLEDRDVIMISSASTSEKSSEVLFASLCTLPHYSLYF